MFKLLFTLTATLALTGCPLDLERTNPDYLGSAFLTPAGDGIPRVDEPETPGIDPEEPETPEVPPEACDGPECEPEVPPEELVPVAHPACVAHSSYPDGVSVGELNFNVTRDEGAPFHAEFRVNDEADCFEYTLGDIDRIEVPERGIVLEPDALYQFDPETGEGAWMGTSQAEAPFIYWFVYIPVLTSQGEQVAEVEIVLGF